MTVGELIYILQKFDEDMPVEMEIETEYSDHQFIFRKITHVEKGERLKQGEKVYLTHKIDWD